jgi:hypothetical protein
MSAGWRAAPLAVALVLASAPPSWAADPGAVRIVVGPAFAPCAGPVLERAARELGLSIAMVVADPRSAAEADLLVGDDDDLTRALEGGQAEARSAVDLGYVPRGPARPLVAVVAVTTAGRHATAARRLLPALARVDARRAFARCAGLPPAGEAAGAPSPAAGYAREVADWWLPLCSLQGNAYNDPRQLLGGPDAVDLDGKDNYDGIMSLGQGGYVVVDMGPFVDRPGPDIRVYQTTGGEPVTVYASEAAEGPFTLLGWRRYCGVRTPRLVSNHCDFDLAEGGLARARFLKIEDGEIYPCRAAGTVSEGSDVDAVEVLGP